MVVSAGILLYRMRGGSVEVLLVHPGGPFWANKDVAAWSIPKGLVEPGEDHLDAAKRELREELAIHVSVELQWLGSCKTGSKTIEAWVAKADGAERPNPSASNTFNIEWPPRSGKRQNFSEVDRAEWFDIPTAKVKLHKSQVKLLTDLESLLASS